jgi:hypothetical protein
MAEVTDPYFTKWERAIIAEIRNYSYNFVIFHPNLIKLNPHGKSTVP